MGRTLQPVQQVIGVWRSWSSTRSAYERLKSLLEKNPPRRTGMALPAPPAGCRWKTSPPRRRAARWPRQAACGSRSNRATCWASSAPAAPASRRWRACWWASGRRRPARCAWTAPTSTCLEQGRTRPAHRLPAAGRRTVRRHHRREHRPLRRGGSEKVVRRPSARRARDDPAVLRKATTRPGRRRRRPVGRPEAAHRPGARDVRRPVAAGARRAQFEPGRPGEQRAGRRPSSDLRQRGKTIVLITHRTSAIGVTNKLLVLRDRQRRDVRPDQGCAGGHLQEATETGPVGAAAAAAAPRGQRKRAGHRQDAPAQRPTGEGNNEIAEQNDAAEVVSHDVTPLEVNTDARAFVQPHRLADRAARRRRLPGVGLLAPLDKGVPMSGTVAKESNRKACSTRAAAPCRKSWSRTATWSRPARCWCA
jgi:hypothetical protein